MPNNTDNAGEQLPQLVKWANTRFPPIDLNKESYAFAVVEMVEHYNILKAERDELREALKIAHHAIIGNDAFLSQPEWEKIEKALNK